MGIGAGLRMRALRASRVWQAEMEVGRMKELSELNNLPLRRARLNLDGFQNFQS